MSFSTLFIMSLDSSACSLSSAKYYRQNKTAPFLTSFKISQSALFLMSLKSSTCKVSKPYNMYNGHFYTILLIRNYRDTYLNYMQLPSHLFYKLTMNYLKP